MAENLAVSYTTGACAAAAAQAAARFLLTGGRRSGVWVGLPGGEEAVIEVEWRGRMAGLDGSAWFAVKKQACGDPDITAGAHICAAAKFGSRAEYPSAYDAKSAMERSWPRVIVEGGPGVGTVTLSGLQVPSGYAAINKIPLAMIKNAVAPLLVGVGDSVVVTVSIPGGEELAKHTFNPRLGIIGGLSLLGTTGLVRPMSNEAYLASLIPCIDVVKAAGHKVIYLCPGNLGEQAALALGAPPGSVAQVSNFVGETVAAAAKRGFRHIVFVGHLGKVAKVAAGHLNTHHQRAPLDLSVVTRALPGRCPELAARLTVTRTAEGAIDILREEDILGTLDTVAAQAAVTLRALVGTGQKLDVVITDLKGRAVGGSAKEVVWKT